jgi:hypothetical protein
VGSSPAGRNKFLGKAKGGKGYSQRTLLAGILPGAKRDQTLVLPQEAIEPIIKSSVNYERQGALSQSKFIAVMEKTENPADISGGADTIIQL